MVLFRLVVTDAACVGTAVGVGAPRASGHTVTGEGNQGARSGIPVLIVLVARNQKREKQNADSRK